MKIEIKGDLPVYMPVIFSCDVRSEDVNGEEKDGLYDLSIKLESGEDVTKRATGEFQPFFDEAFRRFREAKEAKCTTTKEQ